MRHSTKTLICFGLVGGTLFSFNAASQAQVAVTGGNIGGNAAFFIPTAGMASDVKLLDTTVETLNLESAIGNTSTAVFTPTAARFSATSNTAITAGDEGALRGLLTGLAFDNGGFPVLFTNVETQLDFAVDTFDVANTINGGTLISPTEVGAAPLIFIGANVTTTTPGFDDTAGKLELGVLDANLIGGAFALPTDWSFQNNSSNGSGDGGQLLTRRIKFEFEGKDVVPNTPDTSLAANEVRFVGESNKKFKVQTVGTQSSAEFKL